MSALRSVGTGRRRRSSSIASDGVHSFTLILDGDLDEDRVERLYERCPDATVGTRAGVPYAAFDRAAPTLAEAVSSAIGDVEQVTRQHVVRVAPEELVNAADIARRTGRSRESVRLLVEGERGPGGFPRPVAWVGKRPLWAWVDVAGWLVAHGFEQSPAVHAAAFLSALNGALNVRRLVPHLSDRESRDALGQILAQDAALLSAARRSGYQAGTDAGPVVRHTTSERKATYSARKTASKGRTARSRPAR